MTRAKQRGGRGRTVLEPMPTLRGISVTINGEDFDLNCKPARTLLEVLRDDLDLTGTKQGCDGGECGACTVLIEGEPRLACVTLAATLRGKKVLTIEGLAKDGNLHPLQRTFLDRGAVQCGYCTPGMILSASALLNQNPAPTVEDVKKGLAGNLCRCTGYQKIIDAVLEAARLIQEESGSGSSAASGGERETNTSRVAAERHKEPIWSEASFSYEREHNPVDEIGEKGDESCHLKI